MSSIKIMLVDDHMVVRRGLSHVIRTFRGMEIVAEAESGEEALLLCRKHRPDIVLMDVKMDGMDGIATTEAISKFYPDTRIIALSTFVDKGLVKSMIDAGARGYLLKNASVKELSGAIRVVYAGKSVFASEAEQALDTASMATGSGSTQVTLTERQKEVLTLMVAGLSNNEIASELTISLSTARYHVSEILAKLGVSNRTEATAFALKHDLIDS